ncbi:hypothetical protein GOBAR_AA11453 [Gossypium barbadense]|uniref:SWIM-type domain-containing protein n=1 Tax=Gossypium barbadense TaxID=3634 RepID=A0A2P5Y0X4_GOSBA|nr:hypothetical protein GOBAR_AA11453 [Gossypium barbadense]
MEAGHVFVKDVRDAIAANCLMARSMAVEVYSRRNETFQVTETIGRRLGIPPRSYGVDLRNRRYVRDAIAANCLMARSMAVEVYSRRNETFQVTETIGRRLGIPPRSYGVDLRNRRCDCRRFQTLHYPCAHVVTACAKVSLNIE